MTEVDLRNAGSQTRCELLTGHAHRTTGPVQNTKTETLGFVWQPFSNLSRTYTLVVQLIECPWQKELDSTVSTAPSQTRSVASHCAILQFPLYCQLMAQTGSVRAATYANLYPPRALRMRRGACNSPSASPGLCTTPMTSLQCRLAALSRHTSTISLSANTQASWTASFCLRIWEVVRGRQNFIRGAWDWVSGTDRISRVFTFNTFRLGNTGDTFYYLRCVCLLLRAVEGISTSPISKFDTLPPSAALSTTLVILFHSPKEERRLVVSGIHTRIKQ